MKRLDSFQTKEEAIAYIQKNVPDCVTVAKAEKYLRDKLPKESYYQDKIINFLKKTYPQGVVWKEAAGAYSKQGIPDDYIIDRDYTGKPYGRTEQVKRCGNAVCPPLPAALVRANLPELCVAKRTGNMRIKEEQTGQLRFA